MAKTTKPSPAVQTAAKAVAKGDGVESAAKRMVTLYLNSANYKRLQKLHERQTSKIIDQLIEAYLAAAEPDAEKSKVK